MRSVKDALADPRLINQVRRTFIEMASEKCTAAGIEHGVDDDWEFIAVDPDNGDLVELSYLKEVANFCGLM